MRYMSTQDWWVNFRERTWVNFYERQRLVDPMREGDASDDHLELVANGEVRQPESSGRVLLCKEDLALGAIALTHQNCYR